MVQKAININNELWELRGSGRNLYAGFGVVAGRTKYTQNYRDPMELDTIQEKKSSRPN